MAGRDNPCPCGSGKKYKHCCLSREESRPSGVADALSRALEGQNFFSIEEVRAFLNQLARQRNRAPLDEFHGLSPDRVHRLLYSPFESPGW